MSYRHDGRLISYNATAAIGVVQAVDTNMQATVYGADLTAASISTTPNADKFLFAFGTRGNFGVSAATELQKYT